MINGTVTGRINRRRIDLTGKRFGRLTVIEKAGNRTCGESKWQCKCDCGKLTIVTSSRLRKRWTRSCGCLVGERHGHSGKKIIDEYKIWSSMKRRCYYVDSPDYPSYGGRGITVCDFWRHSFSAFLADMGPRPSKRHSIDRFPNNNGNYEPGNCRWATPSEQSNNRRSAVVIEFDGRTLTAHEWSHITGINQEQLTKRIGRGWTPERALTQPMRKAPYAKT